jgi:hypothetical protein
MINWPEPLRHAEDWTNGFWTGAALATSLIVVAGAAMVMLVRAI